MACAKGGCHKFSMLDCTACSFYYTPYWDRDCPMGFTAIPPMPFTNIHPCSGCSETRYDSKGILSCHVTRKIDKAEAQKER